MEWCEGWTFNEPGLDPFLDCPVSFLLSFSHYPLDLGL